MKLLLQRTARPGAGPHVAPPTDVIPDPPAARPPGGIRMVERLRAALMSGVSYAIPFVVTGGMLIALGHVLGGPGVHSAPPVAGAFDITARASWAALLFQIGTVTFGLLVPVLAGYLAHAIADRPALVPGFVGGILAVQTGAGYLGGLLAGVLAGVVVHQLARWRPPAAVARLQPVLVLPLLATVVVGALMLLVVGGPLAALIGALTVRLESMSAGSTVLLGAVLGLMSAVDLGGPVNKTAFTFAVTGLSTGSPTAAAIMAAVMAAGMTPPLAMALASTVHRRAFSQAERQNGRAAWLLGAFYVTEGAIPFAAADPMRVIPSLIAGSATAGGLCVALGTGSSAPHGGILVFPMADRPLALIAAVAAGVSVSAAAVLALKVLRRRASLSPASPR